MRVGLIGCGVVGGGVAEALLSRQRPWERDGISLKLVRAADLKWPAKSPVPKRLRTRDADDVINDENVDVVVELVGGTSIAYTIVDRALDAGKSVVTANKALLAERGLSLFRKAEEKGCEIAFEAAVAGGIPVLQSILDGLSANSFRTVYGILNGTTNFILTRMAQARMPFGQALSEAQAMGFAEADPTLDVDGVDAAHKIQLLTALAYGQWVNMDKIPVKGIRSVDPLDIDYAAQLGCVIKLLAVARQIEEGLEIGVAPTLIPRTHELAPINNETNAVFLHGDRVGDTLLVGKGAGRHPTASAVVSDLVRLALNPKPRYAPRMANATVTDPVSAKNYRSRYYLRITVVEKAGVLAKITSSLGEAGISIASVVQLEKSDQSQPVPVALLTYETTADRVHSAVRKISRLSINKAPAVVFPMVE